MKTIIYSHKHGNELPQLEQGMFFNYLSGVYLHGDLEHKVGYDITYVPVNVEEFYTADKTFSEGAEVWVTTMRNFYKLETGVYPVIIKADDKEIEAIAHIWEGTRAPYRGLICLASDEWAMKDAQDKYERQQEFL